jgi:1-acyl-sn-glycerol-3-phosphate acyltransferase
VSDRVTPRRSVVDRLADRARFGSPGEPSAGGRAFVRAVTPLVDLLLRPTIEGLDRLPRDRPALLVANHSGGGVAEVAALARLWLEHGAARPLTAMAHPVAFHVPGAAAFLRSVGAIPSTYRHAEQALARGVSVIVFPGGDHDAFRPLWRARRVEWNGRSGFARLARTANVPIVPVGIRGSHITLPILWRSSLLPWLLIYPRLAGLKRLPVTVPWLAGLAAIAGVLHDEPRTAALAAYGWSLFPVAHMLPVVPSRVSFHLGEPLAPEALFEGVDDHAAARRVEAAVQALVDPSTATAPQS